MTNDGHGSSAAALSPSAAAPAGRTNVPYAYETSSVLAPDPTKPRRMNYGDAIRILGTVAVVMNHVCDMHLGGEVLSAKWWVFTTWDAAMRWAVPAYIMLSGALLLDPARAEPPTTFYKKRLARIGIPLVFWTAFFIWFSFHVLIPRNWGADRHQIWINLLQGKPYAHLHFIFRIAGLYAFTPMIRVFLRHAPRGMQIGTVILLLGFSTGDSIMNGITHSEASMFMRFAPFLGYYLAGYLLRDACVTPKQLRWCWVGYFACVAILAGGTGFLIAMNGGKLEWYPSVPMMLFDFLSPIRIVMALFSWLILVTLFHKPWPHTERGRARVAWWAGTTLGLYLVHPLFRELFYINGFSAEHPLGNMHLPWFLYKYVFSGLREVFIGIPLMSLMVYVPSLITTSILMKIPYVRRITG